MSVYDEIYEKGVQDGKAEAERRIEPLIAEIREKVYQQGKADEKNRIENKVAEWFGRSQDGWIPCQQVIEICEEIEVE